MSIKYEAENLGFDRMVIDRLIALSKDELARYLVFLLQDGNAFAVEHPSSGEVTYARESRNDGMANIVMFSDKNGQDVWYLIQRKNFVDSYCTDSEIFNLTGSRDTEKLVNKIRQNKYNFDHAKRDIHLTGILFSSPRPYHFIYDQYVNYFQLSELGEIDSKCFSDRHCFIDLTKSGRFRKVIPRGTYLLPITEGSNYASSEAADMHKFAVKMGNQSSTPLLPKEGSLNLWIGVTGQKRKWLGQLRSYAAIINKLCEEYDSINLVVDGWTNYVNENRYTIEDHYILNQLKERISSKVNIINVINHKFLEKLSFAQQCDVYISNNGSGAMIPQMFCALPGVQHGNGKVNTFRKSYNEFTFRAKKTAIRKSVGTANHSTDYFIHWTHIYNLLAEALNITKVDETSLTSEDMIVDVFESIDLSTIESSEMALAKMVEAFTLVGDTKGQQVITSILRKINPRFELKYPEKSIFDIED